MSGPAFQLYADDFLAGTMEMSQEEVGAYIRLLCHQWNRGSIPVETEKQQRLAGGGVSVDVLVKFPAGDDGQLRNLKLERVRDDRKSFIESQREKGRKSAESRKDRQPGFNRGSTGVDERLTLGSNRNSTLQSPVSSLQSPSSTPSPNTPITPKGDDAQDVLTLLNELTGSSFRMVKGNLDLLKARLGEPGVSKDGVLEMVRRQCKRWKGTEFATYLRPSTLFRASKFEEYYAARDLPLEIPTTNGRQPTEASKRVAAGAKNGF